jgi:hypothetical protein
MRAVLIVLLFGTGWLLACAAPGQVGVKTPQGRGSDYPPVIETGAQQEAETAWRAFLTEFQLPETKLDTEPVLNTPRALPLSLAGKINVHTKGGAFDELAAKDALRRFIERAAVVLSGGQRETALTLRDLSLVTFNDEGSMYRAVYQQRNFPYPLASGYGELALAVSKAGLLLQWGSRLLPRVDLTGRTLLATKDLPDRFVGRTFSYTSIAGQPLSYRVANRSEAVVKDPVIYPKLTGNRLTLHIAYPIEVGSGTTWTVFADAVTGEELDVRQNFAS